MAEAIPVFNDILALNASVCFAPLAIMLPGAFWLHDHKSYHQGSTKERAIYWSHWLLPVVGAFFFVGGTYATIQSIITSNQTGGLGKSTEQISCFTVLKMSGYVEYILTSSGKPFDCANTA